MTIPQMTKTASAPRTLAEYAILGLLSRGERSGYDLNRIAQQSTMMLAPTKSRIYAVLPRLLGARLVSARRVAQTARPDKSVYRLTPRGRDALVAWLNEIPEEISRQELALKVFFGELADRRRLLEQLEIFRSANAAEIAFLERLRDGDQPGFFQSATLDYGITVDRALDRWVRRTIAALVEPGV
jgi:DNA-binding PadR family transcriptional regulator